VNGQIGAIHRETIPAWTNKRYWSGERTRTPLIECLLTGRFYILGTEVRKRAYETIKRVNPNGLAMLELSRLAVEFDSDLGSVSPWIKKDLGNLIASYVFRYTEMEGLEVFRQAITKWKNDSGYPINFEDVKPLTSLEKDDELDKKFSVLDLRPFEKTFRVDKASKLDEFARLALDDKK
jgi:hypothetical protein